MARGAAGVLARASQSLLAAGGTLLLAGRLWGGDAVLDAGKALALAGAVAGAGWLAAEAAGLWREGNLCVLETYVTMGLWIATPWGLYVQARQLLGEVSFRRSAVSDVSSYKPPLTLRPPFTGCWWVVNGGVTREESHSWEIVAQRFAYDLVAAGDAGKVERPCRYRRLEDWETYGSPVLAAAPGIVVKAFDGVPDNRPVGRIRITTTSLEGNHVVIKHGEGLYSLYAHLRRGSVLVEPGQEVDAGQQLGEAGNSGMSTIPHLHFQLMTTDNIYATVSLPVYVRYATPNGRVAEGYLRKGSTICAPQPSQSSTDSGEQSPSRAR